MPHRLSLSLLFLLLFNIAGPAGYARRARPGAPPPKALLVILKTRQRQVDYMTRKYPDRLPGLRRDIQGAMMATVRDFNDHFDFCPVYFFADTLMEAIKAGHYDGVLLDAALKPVHQTQLAEGDTSVFIADFGHMSQSTSKSNFEPPAVSLREVLLVMDTHFELLKWPLPATARGYFSRRSIKYRSYWYRSDNYEIDYTPQAAAYSHTLERYYRDIKKPVSSRGYRS